MTPVNDDFGLIASDHGLARLFVLTMWRSSTFTRSNDTFGCDQSAKNIAIVCEEGYKGHLINLHASNHQPITPKENPWPPLPASADSGSQRRAFASRR